MTPNVYFGHQLKVKGRASRRVGAANRRIPQTQYVVLLYDARSTRPTETAGYSSAQNAQRT